MGLVCRVAGHRWVHGGCGRCRRCGAANPRPAHELDACGACSRCGAEVEPRHDWRSFERCPECGGTGFEKGQEAPPGYPHDGFMTVPFCPACEGTGHGFSRCTRCGKRREG